MTETSQRYGRVANGFARRIEGVTPAQWSDPTPCTDWTVVDLVAHVIGTQRRVLANVDGSGAIEVDGTGDLGAQWQEASTAVREALDDERARTMTSGMFGEQSFESLVGRMVCSDTLVHTWDLARATGQDEHLDPAAMAKASSFLSPLDEAIRRPGGFAARIEPSSDADEQTTFLNFCGRAV